ncbi:conserved hypothetical protein [Aggregatibacter segnis ATCC 33393]|uniref:Uncharacterized protein n=1 Tax=Aggregatibacter segnis ATCC 33393 TaxID=888057 RepID=E6KZM6_9PAST|nr:conserved hypothetical protein [Aggregatibacter segnis ATCC 33393]
MYQKMRAYNRKFYVSAAKNYNLTMSLMLFHKLPNRNFPCFRQNSV